MVDKQSLVKTRKLNPKFFTYIAEPIDLYYRKPNVIGVVSYPIYETLNHYWYVYHEDGNGAVYHEDELEEIFANE